MEGAVDVNVLGAVIATGIYMYCDERGDMDQSGCSDEGVLGAGTC